MPASVATALQEIGREFEQGKLRQKSDFFSETANTELTPQLAVQLLGRTLGDSDAMDGYIKWQLLSAITGDIPEELANAAFDAYRKAPGLQRRPGMEMKERIVLDRELRKAVDGTAVAAQLDMGVRRTDDLNKSVLAYRDELFSRLPSGMRTFEAALNDVYERCRAGAEPQSLTARLSGHATQWISRDASDAEVKQFAGMVTKLKIMQMPDYYDGVTKNDQGPGYVWNVRRADPNSGERLDEILQSAGRRLNGAATVDTTNTGRTRSTGRRGR